MPLAPMWFMVTVLIGLHMWTSVPNGCAMGLLPDTQNGGLHMHRECLERFPHHQLQRKPLLSNPGMHRGTCVTHVPWCMSGSLTLQGRGKRSRHSRRVSNMQFYVSGKRPMQLDLHHDDVINWKHFPRYWPFCGEFTGHRWFPHIKAS